MRMLQGATAAVVLLAACDRWDHQETTRSLVTNQLTAVRAET